MVTPTESYPHLAETLKIRALYFKREDMHPLGSHKGRSIPHMIDEHIKTGVRHLAISSSGNAAWAAGLYVQQINAKNADDAVTLEILVGKNIAPKKLAKLQSLRSEHILVSIHDRPLQTLFAKTESQTTKTIKENSDTSVDIIKSLRQSTDPSALVGYESLAEELLNIPDLAAVFIGTSSGTTAQALADYFLKHQKKGAPTEVHIVQTPSCHPLSDAFDDTTEETDEKSLADAIVDHTALRKSSLIPLIKRTGGSGWIANNESIRIAQDLSKKHARLDISSNSALSLAGLMNALYTSKTWNGSVACIITGE